jgi:hypothetical protein
VFPVDDLQSNRDLLHGLLGDSTNGYWSEAAQVDRYGDYRPGYLRALSSALVLLGTETPIHVNVRGAALPAPDAHHFSVGADVFTARLVITITGASVIGEQPGTVRWEVGATALSSLVAVAVEAGAGPFEVGRGNEWPFVRHAVAEFADGRKLALTPNEANPPGRARFAEFISTLAARL